MWDKALCFITNSKAKAGGTSEKIISQKYQLLLIDLQGQVVHLKKLKCPAEVVDMLIGYEYTQDIIQSKNRSQITCCLLQKQKG